MVWLLCSPDLNPIDNFCSIDKKRVYVGGKQLVSRNWICEAVSVVCEAIIPEEFLELTSVDISLLLSN